MKRSIVIILCLFGSRADADDVSALVSRIKAIGKEGVGNVEAQKAWKELVTKGPDAVPEVLAGLDDAGPVASNWLRAAIETLRDRAKSASTTLPVQQLEAFVSEKRHAGGARRLAYDLLTEIDPSTPSRWLPKMLDDPGQELRRDAVAKLLEQSPKTSDSKQDAEISLKIHKQALQHARDRDQIKQIATQMKKLGVDVNLTEHFGFLTRWQLIGPFNNVGGVGFQASYPPDKGFDPAAFVPGKEGKDVRWQSHDTSLALGLVDLNKVFGNLKGAVAYGYTAFDSTSERPVEIRVGSNNAVRFYLNGQEIFFREEYHHGFEMDQHVGKGVLKQGRNSLMIKVCQNEQTDSWAQQWSFQLRICDALGGAVPVAVALERPKIGLDK